MISLPVSQHPACPPVPRSKAASHQNFYQSPSILISILISIHPIQATQPFSFRQCAAVVGTVISLIQSRSSLELELRFDLWVSLLFPFLPPHPITHLLTWDPSAQDRHIYTLCPWFIIGTLSCHRLGLAVTSPGLQHRHGLWWRWWWWWK